MILENMVMTITQKIMNTMMLFSLFLTHNFIKSLSCEHFVLSDYVTPPPVIDPAPCGGGGGEGGTLDTH